MSLRDEIIDIVRKERKIKLSELQERLTGYEAELIEVEALNLGDSEIIKLAKVHGSSGDYWLYDPSEKNPNRVAGAHDSWATSDKLQNKMKPKTKQKYKKYESGQLKPTAAFYDSESLEYTIKKFDKDRNLFAETRHKTYLNGTHQELEEIRKNFVTTFPAQKIPSLTIEQYAAGKRDTKTGKTNRTTFCWWLENGTIKLGDLGIHGAKEFGIYWDKKKKQYVRSVTKNNTERLKKKNIKTDKDLFIAIKDEISSVIASGARYAKTGNREELIREIDVGNTDRLLAASIRDKILYLYFPELFLSIFAFSSLKAIMKTLGFPDDEIRKKDENRKQIELQLKLIDFKDKHPIMQNWDNVDYSHFLWEYWKERKRTTISPAEAYDKGYIEDDPSDDDNLQTFDDVDVLPTDNFKNGAKKIAEELLIPPEKIDEIVGHLASNNHVLLGGPIGTGKTRLATLIPEMFGKDGLTYRAEVHTATSDWNVQDVIGGIMPKMKEGQPFYDMQDGCVVDTVKQNLSADTEKRVSHWHYVRYYNQQIEYRGTWLVIDEFNRAEIDKAFGPMFTSLRTRELKIPTKIAGKAYEEITIPKDYRIIGTLNTQDKSFLFNMSDALQSRFSYVEIDIPSRKLWEKEIYYAFKNAVEELGIDPSKVIKIDHSRKKVDRPTQVDNPHDFLISAKQAYAFLDTVRLFRKLGTAILKKVYQIMLANYLLDVNTGKDALLSTVSGLADKALDYALNSTFTPLLGGLTKPEIGAIIALHTEHGVKEYFKEARRDSNRQAYLEAFEKVLTKLEIKDKDKFCDMFERGETIKDGDWDVIDSKHDKRVELQIFSIGIDSAVPIMGAQGTKKSLEDLKKNALI